MLYEYALDPWCLSEWETFIRLVEQFGIPYGRLISQFPKAWPRMVHEVCRNFTFRQRQIMGDKLVTLKRLALVRSGRVYDSSRRCFCFLSPDIPSFHYPNSCSTSNNGIEFQPLRRVLGIEFLQDNRLSSQNMCSHQLFYRLCVSPFNELYHQFVIFITHPGILLGL